jgi:hypothetical protein
MTCDEILDEILPNLADEFEVANRNRGRAFWPKSVEERDRLHECIVWLVVEGFAESETMPGSKYLIVKLTPQGYRHLKPRIDALRVLGG